MAPDAETSQFEDVGAWPTVAGPMLRWRRHDIGESRNSVAAGWESSYFGPRLKAKSESIDDQKVAFPVPLL